MRQTFKLRKVPLTHHQKIQKEILQVMSAKIVKKAICKETGDAKFQ